MRHKHITGVGIPETGSGNATPIAVTRRPRAEGVIRRVRPRYQSPIIALMLCLFLSAQSASAQSANMTAITPAPQSVSGHEPGRLIVKFKKGISPAASRNTTAASLNISSVDKLNDKYKCSSVERLNTGKDNKSNYTYKLEFPASANLDAMIKEYQATGNFEYVEMDQLVSISTSTVVPNDPYFVYTWGSNNNGTFSSAGFTPISGADMDMERAWSITTGSSSIIVAVIDAGIKMDHPEFAGRIWQNTGEIAGNGIDDDGNGYVDDYRGWNFSYNTNNPTDDHSHGTNVAGIIGANGNNGIGYAGIDWNCKLMALKALNSAGSGNTSLSSSAIYYATDNGAKVINMSLGGAGSSSQMQDAIDYAYAHNVNVVAAMGNDNTNIPFYPAGCNHVIAVGASTCRDTRASFSNYNSYISVVAPGHVIFGLWYLSNTDYNHGMSGTSQATPNVSGVISLLLAQDPTRTPDQIRAILESTAEDQVGTPSEDVAGFDIYYGHGRVNAYAALSTCAPPVVGAITGTASLCAGTSTTLSDTSLAGTWTSSNTAVATINASSGLWTAVAAGTATISYAVTNSCGVTRATRIVTVNAMPVIGGASAICAGGTATLTGTPTGGTWNSANTGIATINATTGLATGVSNGVATISYTRLGCTTSRALTVNTGVSAIGGTAVLCAGTTTTLTNATSGGSWQSSNVTIVSVGSSTGIATALSSGTSTVYYSLGSCAVSKIVTVNPSPAAIGGTAGVCVGGTTNLTNSVAGGTWASSNTSVATVGTSGIVSGLTAGTASISYTLSSGCRSTVVVSVNSAAAPISGTLTVCAGSTTNLSNTTGGGTWTSATPTAATIGSATGIVTGVAAGTSRVSYILGAGCSVTAIVTVSAAPGTIGGTTTLCDGANVTLTNATAGGTWSSSNTAVATIGTSGIVTGIDAGTTTISYVLASGCVRTATVSVNTAPPAIGGALGLCVGTTTALSNVVSGGTWTSSSATIATVGSLSGIVTGVAGGFATISYTLAGGCRTTSVVSVVANPAAIGGATSVCVGATTTLTETTMGGTWSSNAPGIATVGTSGVITGQSAGITTISYSLGSGCYSIKIVTVNQGPSAITGTFGICAGTTTALTSDMPGGVWSSSASGVASVGTSGIATGVAAGVATISYTVGGCRATAIVTVSALPAAIGGTLAVCLGATTNLTDVTAGGSWSSSDDAIAYASPAGGFVIGMAVGTATVSYTLTTGCFRTVTVTVNNAPAVISGTLTVCSGSTTVLANASSGGTWSSSNVAIAAVGTGGVVTGGTAGTATISYSFAGGCRATAIVTVSASPVAIGGGTTAICEGAVSTLTDATAGGTWSSSDIDVATVGTSGIVSGIDAGLATITYTLSSGCYKTKIVTVNAAPSAIGGTLVICAGTTTALANSLPGGTWASSTAGVATIGTAGIATGIAGGNAIISYTVNGCRSTAILTVNSLPAAIGGTLSVCVGSITNLTNATAGGSWSSSADTIGYASPAGGFVIGMAPGTVTISYTLTTGCYKTATVTVNPVPGDITGTGVVCPGTTTTLLQSSTGGTWSSGTTSVATVGVATGIVTGVAAGNANISYKFSTGCASVFTVTVNPLPATIGGTANVCVGLTTTLTNATPDGTWSSSNGNASIDAATGVVTGNIAGTSVITYTLPTGCYKTITFTTKALPAAINGLSVVCAGAIITLTDPTAGGLSWTSSNPAVATINTSGNVTGVAEGTATMTYTLTSGCYATKSVTVNPLPDAITGTALICAGSTVTLSSGISTDGIWTSSLPAVATVGSSTGVVTGVVSGQATISYTLGTGCRVVKAVTVSPIAPITGTAAACIGLTTTLADATAGGTWSSDNTGVATVGTTGIVTGIAAGNAGITYTTPSGCTRSVVVTINPTPSSVTGSLFVCAGATSALNSDVPGGIWSSSNVAVATIGSASGIASGITTGTATVSYSIATGCRITRIVTVSAVPVAIGGTASVCAGSTVTLLDGTPGGAWSSDNASVATIGTNGVVSGVSAGIATISYTLATGCARTLVVTVNAVATAISGSTGICLGTTQTLTADVTGGTWSSSNITIAGVGAATGIVTGNVAGTANITYTLPGNCRITTPVTVNALPAAITGTTSVCVGSVTNLSDATAGGSWAGSDDAIGYVSPAGGFVVGMAPGTITVTYTLYSTGCSRTTTVTVNALPDAITGTTTVCAGATTALTTTTTGGVWTSGNTAVATVDAAGIVTGVTAGNVAISYTAGGCSAAYDVTVAPLPDAGTISGPSTVNQGSTITLTNAATGGVWSMSNARATVDVDGIVSGVTEGLDTAIYTVTNSCGTAVATFGMLVTDPSFTPITGSGIVCVGTMITLSNSTGGGAWSSSNTSVATVNVASGDVTGVTAGVTVITYTLPGGSYATANVTVIATPSANTGTASVCPGGTTTLSNASAGGSWTSSVPSVATVGSTGVVSGLFAGTTDIVYTLAAGCAATTTVTVNPGPTGISGTLSACVGATTTLANGTPGGAWSSSNTSIATVVSGTGVITGISTGTSVVSYSLGSCRTTAVVTIGAAPAVITGATGVCPGATTTLTDATSGGTWSSSNPALGSIDAVTGVVTGIASGSIVITYESGANCYRTRALNINVAPAAIGGSLNACIGLTNTLTDATPGGVSWTSSMPSVATIGSASGIVTGVSTGTSVVTYTLSTGCATTAVVSVNAVPSAISGSPVCVGSAVTFTNTDGGGTWASSNVAVATAGSATGAVTGIGAGTSIITYTLNGCKRVVVATVNALPGTITGPATVCVGTTATLASATTGGGLWSGNNDLVATIGSASGVVTGISSGNAGVTYTSAVTGCTRSIVITVSVLAPIAGSSSVCTNIPATLTNATTGGIWSSSNTAAATIAASTGVVTAVAAGTTNITYTLSAGCRTSATITVNAGPAAITGATSVCVNLATTLADATGGGTWSSSNAALGTVDAVSGAVTGISAGTPVISYTLANSCYRTYNVTVKALPLPINSPSTNLCVGSTLVVTNPGTGGVSWTSSTPSIATVGVSSGLVTGVSGGTVTITYLANTTCYITKVLTVNTTPSAGVISGAGTIHIATTPTLALTESLPGGTWSSSSTSVATVGATTGIVTGLSAGVANITYTVNNGCGSANTNVAITVMLARPGGNNAASATSADAISLYPNPASGAFTIQSGVAGSFTVYTVEGKEVGNYNVMAGETVVSLPQGTAAGVYMCRYNGNDGATATIRLVYKP